MLLEEHVRKMQLISIKKGLVLKVVLELNSHHIKRKIWKFVHDFYFATYNMKNLLGNPSRGISY